MEKGNVLVIGNSGVGKSTLINAVLGEERAETGWGTAGTSKELVIYDGDSVPFRIVDTVGFEPSLIKEYLAIGAVKKWSKESAKEGHEDNQINVIWLCVEGTTSKLFPKTIKNISRATAMWETVPVIVVITKSYAVPDREKNIEMVHNAFATQKRYAKNLRKVIPVVAATFVVNENAFAPPEGITELIDATNALMPEGLKAAEADVSAFKLKRKRVLAHSITGVATTSAVVIGAVPVPFADALLLAPIELAMVNAAAMIYGIGKDDAAKKLFQSIVGVGTVGAAAKMAISALKAIPGITLGASAVNAIIAGSIVAALGEGTIFIFEQIYLGRKSVADIEWVKAVLESKLSSQFIDTMAAIAEKITQNTDGKTIASLISEAFAGLFGAPGGEGQDN